MQIGPSLGTFLCTEICHISNKWGFLWVWAVLEGRNFQDPGSWNCDLLPLCLLAMQLKLDEVVLLVLTDPPRATGGHPRTKISKNMGYSHLGHIWSFKVIYIKFSTPPAPLPGNAYIKAVFCLYIFLQWRPNFIYEQNTWRSRASLGYFFLSLIIFGCLFKFVLFKPSSCYY